MIKDLFAYIKGSLLHRITRSSLTILSIVLGIMAIYALVSFGQGLNKYVNDVAGDFGTDKLIATVKAAGPPGTESTSFADSDIDFLRDQNDLAVVAPGYMTQYEIRIDPDSPGKWVYLAVLPTQKEEMDIWFFSYDVEDGRLLKDGDKFKAVLGYNHKIDNKLWPKGLTLGKKIYVNDVAFEIVGFLEPVGNPQDDTNVYIPLDAFESVFDMDTQYNYVFMQAEANVNVSELATRLEEKLAKEKGQDKGQEDFYIMSFEEQLQVFSSIIGVLNGILVLIAAVSVLVAAVNIANTMYTAVLERTKEIGIMKAIGSTRGYIKSIFVIESGILGMLGGALGILLGFGIAKMGEAMAAGAGYDFLKPYFPIWLTLGCLAFATAVGTVSGYLPARQAAKLKPVDALRYE